MVQDLKLSYVHGTHTPDRSKHIIRFALYSWFLSIRALVSTKALNATKGRSTLYGLLTPEAHNFIALGLR